jgi:uncharacterized repeat protein (TIGR02543 family)
MATQPRESLWGIGWNSLGEIGNGTTNNATAPVEIVTTNVTAVAAGYDHSLFLETNGSLWVVGYNGNGQIGLGATNDITVPVELVASNVAAISTSSLHSLFRMNDTSLWGMGYNAYGQLGNGTNTAAYTPIEILSNGVARVAAGDGHSLFLMTNGSLWAMGYNAAGQLGNGTTNDSNVPLMIVASNIIAIAAGQNYSLFLSNDLSLWAMGDNHGGAFGNGTSNSSSVPVLITNGVTAISAGAGHSMLIMTNGSMWATGYNAQGQVGAGFYSTNYPYGITNLTEIETSNVVAVSAGLDFSVYVKSDGSLWGAGDNSQHQLDTAAGSQVNHPVEVIFSNVFTAAAGGYHTMFLAAPTPSFPQIGVLDGTNAIVNYQTNAVDFGAVGLNQTGPIVIFTVTNLGGQMLNLSGIDVPAGYALVSNLVTVPGRGNGTFSVQLNTTAVGTNAGSVVITNNDSANNPFVFPVTGTITTAATATLTLLASPTNGGVATGGGVFPVGSMQTATATPASGYQFVCWTSNGTGTNSPLSVLLNTNLTITANFTPVESRITLTVLTNGNGAVLPVFNGKIVPKGSSHALTATAGHGSFFAGWTGSLTTNKSPLSFKVPATMILQANFVTNPFVPIQGVFNGLFSETNGVTEQTAGMLKGLTVNLKGYYSGVLLLNGGSHAINGYFDATGRATNHISRPAKQGGPLTVILNAVDLNPPPQVIGTVSNSAWVSDLVADRATNTLPALEYTLLMPPTTNNAPPTNSPGGDGFALITNYTGTAKNPALAAAKITGALADGTTFSQTVPVSQDGYVPVYASLYGGTGLLQGWINLDLTNTSGTSLTWIHPQRATGLYRNGFTNVLLTNQILLSPWTNPPGASIALLTNLVMADKISDTNVAGLPVQTGTDGKISAATVTGAINPKTGYFTVIIGKGDARTLGYGAILLNATNGGGYFLTKTNAQSIKLSP